MSDREPLLNEQTVPKTAHDAAISQAHALGGSVRKLKTNEKQSNRKMDAARRIVQIGALVTSIILIIGMFIHHPAIDGPYTKQVLGGLVVICVGYIVALEVARGNFGFMLFLMLSGIGLFMFGLGYMSREFQLIALVHHGQV